MAEFSSTSPLYLLEGIASSVDFQVKLNYSLLIVTCVGIVLEFLFTTDLRPSNFFENFFHIILLKVLRISKTTQIVRTRIILVMYRGFNL